MTRTGKILVPTDFSDGARVAIEQADELARALGASLDLLHVWEVPPFLPGELLVDESGAQARLLDLIRTSAHQQLSELVASAERDGIQIASASCVFGIPHATIVDVAKAGKHRLIVLGSRGKPGLARVLLGSVAERVVRHAPCTVVVARKAGPY
jgi:nucleotide-binding universal stress UspA family protein